jgi:hypothetical protein
VSNTVSAKRLSLVLLVAFVAAAWSNPAAVLGAKPGQWALLIGVGDYPEGVPDLAFAPSDALAIRDSLIKRAGFPEDHVKVISDAGSDAEKPTRENILAAVDAFLGANVKTGDEVTVSLRVWATRQRATSSRRTWTRAPSRPSRARASTFRSSLASSGRSLRANT